MSPGIKIFHTDSAFFRNSMNFVNTIHMISIIGFLLLFRSESKKLTEWLHTHIKHLCICGSHSHQNNKLFIVKNAKTSIITWIIASPTHERLLHSVHLLTSLICRSNLLFVNVSEYEPLNKCLGVRQKCGKIVWTIYA